MKTYILLGIGIFTLFFIFGILYRIRRNKRKAASSSLELVIRTSKNGEMLSDYEIQLMTQTHPNHLSCPDCLGALLKGPEGGGAQNCKCEKCGAKYNEFLPVWVQRITDSTATVDVTKAIVNA